jgi:hypothetical protein
MPIQFPNRSISDAPHSYTSSVVLSRSRALNTTLLCSFRLDYIIFRNLAIYLPTVSSTSLNELQMLVSISASSLRIAPI